MLKTIALIGLAAALALPSASAFAVNGDSSSYGTEGYGPTVPTQSLTPFQRWWNHANESKERARAGAAWVRHHGGYSHRQLVPHPRVIPSRRECAWDHSRPRKNDRVLAHGN